ncbi:MAG: SDR family NAD(P)-dependent oxidoreductase, partial [Acidobacteria bacterium]|nr:SDR family NAD(P)-dependent oxidoreductase [Acidobacteriota bacterium]
MDLGLTGKVALVGGSSRGLGYACARELATEGAKVSLCSRDGDQAVAAARRISDETGSETVGFGFDLSITGAPEAWAAASRERLGDVDILVHNTGGPPPGHFEDLDDMA